MRRFTVPGIGVFEYPDGTPDEFIYADVDRRIMEDVGFPTAVPQTAPIDQQMPALEQAAVTETPQLTTTLIPQEKAPEEPERASFVDVFKESFDDIFELKKALKYGFTGDESAGEALLKAGEIDKEMVGGVQNIKKFRDVVDWAKETTAGSAGFIAAPTAAATATAAVTGGVGAPVAFFSTVYAQFLVNNLAEQAAADRERADKGQQKKGPSILAAASAAAGQTALTGISLLFFKPIAKLLGAFGTKTAEETAKGVVRQGLGAKTANKISKGVTKIDDAIAKFNTPKGKETILKSLGKGGLAGAGFEVVQEVAQTVLERAQAGRPLTGDEANKAYLNSIAGAVLLGTPMGALSRNINNYQAQKQKAEKEVLEDIQQKAEVLRDAEVPVRVIPVMEKARAVVERANASEESLKELKVNRPTEQEIDTVLQDAGVTPEDINNLNLENNYEGKVKLIQDVVIPRLDKIFTENVAPKYTSMSDIDADMQAAGLTPESEVKDVDAETTRDSMEISTEPRPREGEGLAGPIEGADTGGVDAAVRGTIDPTKRETKVDAPVETISVDLEPAKFIKHGTYKDFNIALASETGLKGKALTEFKKENKLPVNKEQFITAKEQEVDTLFEEGPTKDKVKELVKLKAPVAIESADNKVVKYKIKNQQKTTRVDKLQPIDVDEVTAKDLTSKIDRITKQRTDRDSLPQVTEQLKSLATEVGAKVPELTINNIETKSFNRLKTDLLATKESLEKGRIITARETKQDIKDAEAATKFKEETSKYESVEQSISDAFGNSFNSQSESVLDKTMDIFFSLKGGAGAARGQWRRLIPPEQLAKGIARRDYGNPELNAKISQAFTQYREAVKNYNDTTARYLNEGFALSKILSTYMHINRKNEKSKNLSDVMYASSYFNVDASLDRSEMQTNAEKLAYDKVRPMYEKLDDKGKEIYKDMGNYTRSNYERYIVSVENTIDELAESATQRKELQEEIKKLYLDKRLNYYVSFSRMGKYWIFFEKNGELVKASVDSEHKARRVVAKLKKQEGVTIRGEGYLEKDEEIAKNIANIPSMTGFKKIINLIDKNSKGQSEVEQKLRDGLKEQLTSFFIKNLPQNSTYLGALARNKDLGFSAEPIDKVFSSQVLMQARQLSTLDASLAVETAIQRVGEVVDSIEDQTLRSQLLEAKQRFSNNLQMNINPGLGKLNTFANFTGSLGFYYYLTSFATPIINLVNTPTMSASMMMGKYNPGEVYNELMNTAIEILGDNMAKGITNPRKTTTFTYAELYGRTNDPSLDSRKYVVPLPTTLSKSEQRALARAYVENVIESNQIVTQSGAAIDINRREAKSIFDLPQRNNLVGTASTILFGTFQGTETLNKEVTFLAAYRLANKNSKPLKTGEKFKDAYSYGKEMARESHGDYSYANSGEYFKHPFGRILLMFKKFPVLMYTNWINSTEKAFSDLKNKGYSEEEIKAIKKEGRRQLLGMATTGVFAAGIYGIPLGFALLHLINLFIPDEDEENPFVLNAEDRVEKYLSSVSILNMPILDTNLGEILFTGVPENIGQFKIANRAGVGAAVAKIPYQDVTELEYWFQMVGGPIGSYGVTLLTAGRDFMNGNPDNAVKAMLPGSLRQIAKVAMMENDGGLVTKKGLKIASDLDSAETFLMFLGFTPKSIDRLYGVKNAEREAMEKFHKQRGELLDDFSKLVLKKTSLLSKIAIALHLDSPDTMETLIKEMLEFNKEAIKAGVLPIDGGTLNQSVLNTLTINFKNDIFGLSGETARSNMELLTKSLRMRELRNQGFID